MKTIRTLLLFLVIFTSSVTSAQKREFRGAWIQCINGQFQGLPTQTIQQKLSRQLDILKADGVNAIIFQVRPECDALYKSDLEPWSRYLTGQQGRAPQPYWDPLQWMIEQCHNRGMELHAWINPFRAKTKGTTTLATTHVAIEHPNWTFPYGGQLILNPALKETTDYNCKVVDDIVSRYDVDGIHIDDYFYPYPVAGEEIPDENYFRANPRGFKNIGDWRRDNVNQFIEQLSKTIHKRKPWVKFGVSPFGIYRNQRSDPKNGSATNGLQNYDDLYADVLLWVNNGWVDYCAPQLYWEIGNRAADYQTLIKWWDKFANNRPLFIGESVERTVKASDLSNPNINQMPAKHKLHQEAHHVDGTVLWYAQAVTDDLGNYGSVLRTAYWKYHALQPLMPFIDKKQPKKPRKVKAVWTSDGYILFWSVPRGKSWGDIARQYVIYRFANGEKIDIENPAKIVSITSDTFYKLPYDKGNKRCTYVVTALDRISNESKGKKIRIKL
jgi:uncharacterized lipoprotein YddW (UPF0748 family)